jgi:hypothetical protein
LLAEQTGIFKLHVGLRFDVPKLRRTRAEQIFDRSKGTSNEAAIRKSFAGLRNAGRKSAEKPDKSV